MKHNLWNAIILAIFPYSFTFAQSTFELTEDLTFDFSKTKVEVSNNAKRARAAKQGGGIIKLNFVNGNSVPEEYNASLETATKIWRDYLQYGDTLKLDIFYEDSLDSDIKLSILYQLENEQGCYYPSVLYRKLYPGLLHSNYDAKIHINTSVDWSFGIGEDNAYSEKNLTLALMQCICKSLGFGTSVRIGQRGLEFQMKTYATIFDSYIVNNNGNRLTDYTHNRNGLQQFATGRLGNVYFSSDDLTAKLYTPSEFDNNTSLRCTDGENCLMDYSEENTSRDLVIDDLSLDILNRIGWNFFNSASIFCITSDDVDSTNITSAYSSHNFYITPTSVNFSSYNWKLILPLTDGNSVISCSSSNRLFTTPAISNPESYEHTIEGDIRGMVVFEGLTKGKKITISRPIIFELKPHIISAKIISTNVNADNPNYFDAVVEIRYEGAHYLHAFVEEEYSPYLTSYYSSTPYYTKMNLTNIDSWGDAWFNITIRNEYGNDNYVLNLYNTDNQDVIKQESDVSNITDVEMTGTDNTTHIEVYDMKGRHIGLYDQTKALPKGIYLLKFYNNKNICHNTKKICVK